MTALLIGNPELLFTLFAALVFLVALVAVVRRWPQAGAGLLIAVLVAGPDLRDPLLSVEFGVLGIEVALIDLVAAVLLGAAVLHIAVSGTPTVAPTVVVGVLGAVLVLNIMRGVAAYGLQPAVNEARQWLYLGAAVAYGSTLPLRDARQWRTLGIAACGWLVLVAAVGFAATGLQPATSPIVVQGELTDPRPVTAAGALVLAEGLMLVLGWRRRSRVLVAVAALGGVLLVLQHRTVWLAAVAGLVYAVVVALRAGGRARLATMLGIGSVAAASVAAFLTGMAQRSAVAASAEDITAADNTFTWRVAGWRELVQAQTEPLQLLLGDPFGAGFARVLAGRLVTVSPHSHYVETFLRFGLLGLGLSVFLLALAWRAAPAAAAAVGVPTPVLRAVLVVAVVYGVAYRLDPLQALAIGTILGLASPRAATPSPGVPSARVRAG